MKHDPDIPAPNVRAIYGLKALALGLILAAYWGIEVFLSPFEQGGEITLAVFFALAPTLAVVAASESVPAWLLRLSLVADVFALSWCVHLAGGADNVSLPLLYPAMISLAGLLLSRTDTFAVALLCGATYSAVVWAEYAGVLPHLVPYARPPHRQLATAIPVSLYLVLYAWLVTFAVEKIRALYRRTEEVRSETMQALAHDLKNPLSVIHGYASLLQEAPEEDRQRFAGGIERTAQQALDLVSNLLDASAFDGRLLRPRVQPVQINDLVRDVAERYRQTAKAAGVSMRLDLAPDLTAAEVDGQLVARALGNLISNALKYTGSGGDVRVSTEAGNGHILVRVCDSGAGILPDELGLLFRRHSRTSSSRGIEGTGLGLYIARHIARAHGGSVEVESTSGVGSTFTLSLPLLGPVA